MHAIRPLAGLLALLTLALAAAGVTLALVHAAGPLGLFLLASHPLPRCWHGSRSAHLCGAPISASADPLGHPASASRRRATLIPGPMREMTVYGVSFDLVGKQPIVLLKTQDGNTFLPIWIGHPEAAAILMKLQGSEPQRPMTHDLLAAMINSLDAEIRSVTVTELRENTFHARITLVRDGNEIEIDSRTSDAIALALRADAKIFAADEVIEESGVEFEGDEEEASRQLTGQQSLADLDPAEFRRFLDTVTPDEFGADPEEEI